MADQIPQKLGKYEIKGVLGKGAMGIVYDGFDPLIERRVAIKAIHKNLLEGDEGAELINRFKREAQAAGRLMHQNIVAIYEYGEEDGTPFIAMEFVQGKELKDYIKDQARFEVRKVVDIMSQTLDAMEYVHAGGVVHRDMKPANIILLENGAIKVADFGIARVESSTMTQMGAVMGTPSYMSPEQFMGQRVDKRADLFSMGVILYELLTGEKPFPGKAVATIMQKVLNSPVEDPTNYNFELPGSFNAVIKRALAKRLGERFQSAREFKEAIKLAEQDKYVLESAPHDESVEHEDDSEETILMGAEKPSGTPKKQKTEHTSTQHPNSAASSLVTPAAKSSSMGLMAGGGVALLAVVAGGWWFTRSPAVSSPETTTTVQPDVTKAEPVSYQPPAATAPIATGSIGSISAISTPPGASIMVDGEFMGITPLKFDLPSGEYQLVLKKDGFYELDSSIDVEIDDTLELDVALDPL
jgi:eukaryotic-like serine/threonine-protein kinase